MLYSSTTYTTTGAQPSKNLDPSIAAFAASVACAVGSTADYKLQFSLSPMDVADASAIWFDSTEIPASTTTSKTTAMTSPVARVRVNITAVGTTLILQILQGISSN